MDRKIDLSSIYMPTKELMTAKVDDGLLLVPFLAGIADFEDGVLFLNEMSYCIWNNFDGEIALKQIVEAITEEYDASIEEIKQDVLGLVEELVARGILIENRKS